MPDNPDYNTTRPRAKQPAKPVIEESPFQRLQRARKELRHRAHVYANTKEGASRDAAGEVLDQAALALALAASLQGLCGPPPRPSDVYMTMETAKITQNKRKR